MIAPSTEDTEDTKEENEETTKSESNHAIEVHASISIYKTSQS